MILNSDTLVANHGYQHREATSFPSVLKAGTAVMVDATGMPRVKCNCGNPLTPPELFDLSTATTSGTSWPGYTPAAVLAVQPGAPAQTLTLVNVSTGIVYDQSLTGSNQLADGGYRITLPEDARACVPYLLNGGMAMVRGTMVTVVNETGKLFIQGTVERTGANFTLGMRTVLGSSLERIAAASDFDLTGTVGSDGTLAGIGVNLGTTVRGEAPDPCDFAFTLATVDSAPLLTTSPPTTPVPTTPVPTTVPATAAPQASADCTVAAVLPVLNPNPNKVQVMLDPGSLWCDGDWAIAGPTYPGEGTFTVQLRNVNGAWTRVAEDCSIFPASLLQYCESN